MPTYEYDCARCGTVEVFQSMRDDPLTSCPECRSKRFQRRISGGAGVIFRGSGFYETDYNRSGDYAQAAKSEQSGGGDAAGGKSDAPAKSAETSAASKPTKPTKPPSGGAGGAAGDTAS